MSTETRKRPSLIEALKAFWSSEELDIDVELAPELKEILEEREKDEKAVEQPINIQTKKSSGGKSGLSSKKIEEIPSKKMRDIHDNIVKEEKDRDER